MSVPKWSLGLIPLDQLRRISDEHRKREEEDKMAYDRRQTKLRQKLLFLQICLASPWAITQMAKGWRPQLSGQGLEEQIATAKAMLDLRGEDDPARKMAVRGLKDLDEIMP
jgi:hypothetical protein